MGTNYIAPIWRMPENINKDKLSNYSIEFDSSNTDYIQISDNNLSGLEKFSISIWYNTAVPETSGDRALFASWSGTTQQAILYLDNPNGWRFLWNDGVGASGSVAGPSTVTVDQWNHIVITYDGATVKFYHNNGTPTTNATVKGPIQASTSLPRIGSDTNTTKLWDGKISQFCLFDKAIDASQVEYLYNLNNPMVPGSKNLPTPIQYLPLGDNSNPNATGSFPNIVTGADSVFDFIPNDYIDLGTNLQSTLSLAQNTISIWFRSDTASDFDTLFSQGNGSSVGYRLFVSGTSLSLNRSEQSPTNDRQTVDIPLEHQTWNHVVLVTDTSNAEYLTAYLNGDPVGTYSTGTITYNNGGSEAWIGGQFGISQYWDGQVSNVQIWSTNISAAEVTTLYNNGQPLMTGTQPQAANLQAWYKLNQSANWEADTANNWQIPDAVSSYPQSFDFGDATSNPKKFIDVPRAAVNVTDAICVSAWVKTQKNTSSEGNGQRQAIISNYYSGDIPNNGCWKFHIGDGWANGYTKMTFWCRPASEAAVFSVSQTSGQVITDNTWHHVVVLWDGTTTADAVKIFVDGLLAGQGTASATSPIATSTTSRPSLGKSAADSTGVYGNGYYLGGPAGKPGFLSNVQVWDTALTYGTVSSIGDTAGGQVAQLYNNGVPLTTAIASDNLKGWWKLSDNEKFDGTNWSVENQKYPANYEGSLGFTGNDVQGSELSLASSTTPSDDTAVSFWMKADSQSGYGTICYGGGGTDMAYQYLSTNGSGSNLYIYDGTFTKIIDDAYNGKWNHIVISYDNSANEVKGYKNGVLDQTVTATWGNQSFIDRLGFRNNIRYYNGQLSNFGIFTSVLEQSDVNTLYNNGTPLVDMSSFSSLDAFWKLDNLASGLLDTIGNNNASTTDVVKVNNFVSTEAATSSGMTEQNLVNNNVSVLNGESSGMDTINLVQSNLTRKQPFSSYSFNFDQGASDYFNCSNVSVLQNASVITWNLWVNFARNDFNVIFGKALNTTDVIQFYTWGAGRGYFWLKTAGSAVTATIDPLVPGIVPLNEWAMFTIVFDGSQSGNYRLMIYLNGSGTNIITNYSATPPATLPNTTDDFFIGRGYNGYFDGKISNLAIWDSALTFDDINNLYNNGVPQDLNNFRIQPVNWWPLDENSSYYGGADWITRDVKSGQDGDGNNTGNVDDLVGNAPGSDANGIGNNLVIASLKGDMYDSELNAYSINMADYADSVVNPANSGRSTNVP